MAKRRPNGAGTLRKRSNGLWEMRLSLGYDPNTGKLISKSFYGRSQAEARRKGEEFQAQWNAGMTNMHNYTAMEWGEWFLEHHAKFAKLKYSTIESCRYVLKLIEKDLGYKKMADLKPYEVERFLVNLQDAGYSASTISKVKGFLFQMGQAAVANGVATRNVVAYVAKMRYQKPTPKEIFTAEEIRRMMQDLPQNKIGWSIRILLMTGLRSQEMLGLEPRHIAVDGSTITVEQAVSRKKGTAYMSDTKNETSRRVVPVPSEARKYALLLRNGTEGSLIWESPKKPGHPINPSHFAKLYYGALDSTSVRHLSPHCTRHTFASQMLGLGVDLRTIQDIMGHADIKMTREYVHLQDNVKSDAVNCLNVFC